MRRGLCVYCCQPILSLLPTMLCISTLRRALPSVRAFNSNTNASILANGKHLDTLPSVRNLFGLVDREMLKYPRNKFHKFFVERREQLGDMYILSPSIFCEKSVVICTPDLVSELISKEGEFPVRRKENNLFNQAKRAVGLKPGILSNGVEWKNLKVPLSKRFLKPKSLAEYLAKLSSIAGAAVRNITERDTSYSHFQQLCVWTIDSSYYLLFHTQRDRGGTRELTEFVNAVLTVSRSSVDFQWYDLRRYLPSREWSKLINSFNTVISYTERQIAASQSQHYPMSTEMTCLPLLEYLLKETNFDYVDILDSFITFLSGSMDATVISTQWLWYHLAKHPEVQDRVCEEVLSVVGDNPIITTEQYNQLHYIKLCMKESMRLTPTANIFSRILQEDNTLGGVRLPKGTQVIADLYGMGQDERYWRDPREFLPERWENRKDIDPFSYIPFGVGPRMCIGRRLAEAEMQLITAQLCRSYRLHLVQEPECSLEVMMVPEGLELSFEKRDMTWRPQ